MQILPAIDLRDGHAVRLQRGDYDQQTTYSDRPADVAKEFVAAGAKWIHVVDLDAARSGVPSNTETVRSIIGAADVDIQMGGGIRNEKTIDDVLTAGVSRAVIGSAALKDWPWFERMVRRGDLAGRIALALDARNGKLALQGWTEQVEVTPLELARRVKGWPLGAIVYTDISRDGMLTGVNIDGVRRLVEATDVPVIASGGVASIEDIHLCKENCCGGVIVGKAYYEGRLDLEEACRIAGND
ncbi:MAG: 1-(5-phosphoribosyl)-5-[(5-phosphoribosylamino)methylideneamino]imidazole-4-carboxamide isomerase [Planctomycetota bacterium]